MNETCVATGKVRYSKERANKQAAWCRRKWLARMQPYKCKACGSWHIGNYRPRKPKAVRP